jgi:hypothetical protein
MIPDNRLEHSQIFFIYICTDTGMSNAHIHLFVKENTLYNIGQIVDQSTDLMLLKMVVYYITAAGNSVSSQLDSSCQGNRYGKEKAGCTARPSRTKSHLPGHSPPVGQAGRRVGPAL